MRETECNLCDERVIEVQFLAENAKLPLTLLLDLDEVEFFVLDVNGQRVRREYGLQRHRLTCEAMQGDRAGASPQGEQAALEAGEVPEGEELPD